MIPLRLLLAAIGVLMMMSSAARAHSVPMAVLLVQQTDLGRFTVRWLNAPTLADDAEAYERLRPRFPPHCSFQAPQLDCGSAGLVGPFIAAGLDYRYPAMVLRLNWRSGATTIHTLTTASPRVVLTGSGSEAIEWRRLAATYIPIGIEHILLGVDHLLFVLGLIWIVSTPMMLVKTISAFTIAHSLTLAAATLGWVGVPEAPVNAAIALSIVFVGVEVVKVSRGEGGLTARYPWAVAFAFGLLHGFGFARALTDLGLSAASVPVALLFFNIGVEIGQLAFVLLVLALIWAHRRLDLCPPRGSELIPAYGIGVLAMFWCIDRVVGFWPA